MKYSIKDILEYLRVKRTSVLVFLVFAIAISSLILYATATESTNIKEESKFAWNENGGWFNFGSIDGGVMVTDAELTGYVWSENFGWISLNCENNNSCATSDYKVANDGGGNLSGYAWGENIGFVNFNPANGGVHIDASGIFSGYAWGENIGWLVFNCADLGVCTSFEFKVATTWIPLSARENDDDDDTESLEVYDVHHSSTDSEIAIEWRTNNNADSHIRWGKDKNLSEEKDENQKEKKHKVTLRDLDPDTRYYFRVKSIDGNDSSDSSRIYEVMTKPESGFFDKRQWESFDGNSNNEEYEKVEIEVSDKKEDVVEDEEKNVSEETASVEVHDAGQSTLDIFSNIRNGIVGFFSGARDMAFGGQRGILKLFASIGRGFEKSYRTIIAVFNEEKAMELVKIEKAKFFTTEISKRDEKKRLAEARFQILDSSENPIPRLETTLFSEPQTTVTDDEGIASFKDVPIGTHTLAFAYEGTDFKKKVAIADTMTEEGKVRMEVVQVKAEREKIAVWMWGIILLLVIFVGVSGVFIRKYYALLYKK